MIEIVSATRLSESEFWQSSALGQSLMRLRYDTRIQNSIRYENTEGLAWIYNQRIKQSSADILVFIHDDVWIDDFDFGNTILAGLKQYDVIGVVGNKRRIPYQPSWYFIDVQTGNKDLDCYLSGEVGQGPEPFGRIMHFGMLPASCELLDGLCIIANRHNLIKHQVYWDPRFDFHFYDIDFSRSARQAGLELGTWPIGLTHQSGGLFGSPSWFKNYQLYLEKWGD